MHRDYIGSETVEAACLPSATGVSVSRTNDLSDETARGGAPALPVPGSSDWKQKGTCDRPTDREREGVEYSRLEAPGPPPPAAAICHAMASRSSWKRNP